MYSFFPSLSPHHFLLLNFDSNGDPEHSTDKSPLLSQSACHYRIALLSPTKTIKLYVSLIWNIFLKLLTWLLFNHSVSSPIQYNTKSPCYHVLCCKGSAIKYSFKTVYQKSQTLKLWQKINAWIQTGSSKVFGIWIPTCLVGCWDTKRILPHVATMPLLMIAGF